MPIRFRCAYCNQLMGIARRKAGQVVKCPTCGGEVVVPTDEEGAAAASEPVPESSSQQARPLLSGREAVFEQSDFDKILSAPPPGPDLTEAADESSDGPWSAAPSPEFGNFERAPRPSTAPGILLTPRKATLLTILGILLLAFAFGAGVLVGKFVIS